MYLRLRPTSKLFYLPFEVPDFGSIATKAARPPPDDQRNSMTLSSKSLAGPGYVILNCIRVLNVIGLLAVITASVVMMVKISLASRFFFFDAVSHVVTVAISMFLLISELSLFPSYFARNWPLLSPAHGFVTLALAMLALGLNTLGHLNKQATSQDSLGLPFWRVVIASGILVFILGFVNLTASYVFRDHAQGITARQVRAHGASVHKSPMTHSSPPSAPELAQSSITTPTTASKHSHPFHLTPPARRPSLLPSYHSSSTLSSPAKETPPPPSSPTSRYSRATTCTKKKVLGLLGRPRESLLSPPLPIHPREPEISGPVGVNPQFAHLLRRPDSALHPSRTGEAEAFRWKAVV